MLLLYRLTTCILATTGLYLHSTMLLLYRGGTGVEVWYYGFTFHYASTLSKANAAATAALTTNLHSTMLLLYHRRKKSYKAEKNIYIPLCFYFIENSEDGITSERPIYIPLCFYFIEEHFTRRRGALFRFTFHYASTLSNNERRYLSAFFTIYIPLCFYFIDCGKQQSEEIDIIYIPLCFYFIGLCICDTGLGRTFTFHYASTLSKSWLETRIGVRIEFTFHYASTLSLSAL